jgi:3alpha(or 20beta)-hydroxysteroid dehydrogenase
MADRLEGRNVLVTGALGGLGYAVVERVLRDGASGVVLADVDGAELDECVAALRDSGANVRAARLDVTSEASWASAVEQAEAELGRVDVLVNNAGITCRDGVLGTSLEDWDRVVAVNLTGVFLGMKHLGAHMVAAGGGAVVNIASFASYTGYRAASYAASKWGVRGLTQTAADELGPQGIRVNSVSPGFVATPLTANAPGLVSSFADATSVRRPCAPEDIAAAVAWLASDDAGYVTGHDLLVDGGFSANTIRDVRA